MKIDIIRNRSNNLYTEGTIIVNGAPLTATVEHTFTMLPTGTYTIRLVKKGSGRRFICIEGQRHIIAPGNCWRDALARTSIVLGDPLIPGAVQGSREHYTHLFDRMDKCTTPITLTVSDDRCVESHAIRHWLM